MEDAALVGVVDGAREGGQEAGGGAGVAQVAVARALGEAFGSVLATDIHDYPASETLVPRAFHADFLGVAALPLPAPDWIVTNPPFSRAARFAAHALRLRPKGGVALFVRLAFLESIERWELFRHSPPAVVAPFVERVPVWRGRIAPKGGSTATAYAWVVWRGGVQRGPTRLMWIPPCRKALEQPGDYPEREAA